MSRLSKGRLDVGLGQCLAAGAQGPISDESQGSCGADDGDD